MKSKYFLNANRFSFGQHLIGFSNKFSRTLTFRGFSLLEVALSIGVFGIMVLFFLSVVKIFFSGITDINTNNSVANTMERALSVFGDDDRFCTAVLGNLTINPSNPDGNQIASLEFHDLKGLKQNVPPVLSLGLPVNKDPGLNLPFLPDPNLITQDIRLKPITGMDTVNKTITARLEITFAKQGGTQTTRRGFPIYALLDNSYKILKCSTSASFFNLNNLNCSINSDGYQHLEMDSVTKKLICSDNKNIRYFTSIGLNGQLGFVQCGPGYRPAISPKNIKNSDIVNGICTAKSTGSKVKPREYLSGTISRAPKPVFEPTMDYAGSSCTYDIDVNVINYSFQIRCVN